MGAALDRFWRHVFHRADDRRVDGLARLFRDVEIGDFRLNSVLKRAKYKNTNRFFVLRKKHVLRLEIAMDDVLAVDEL